MTKRKQNMLIFLCWALYTSAYLGRYSYNSNILPISEFYNVSDTEVGLATSFFFFAYGAGQIINGLLCKFYNVKYVLSGSLIVSTIINAVIYLGFLPFEYVKFLWLVNGLAQSVLWSSLLMTLSRNIDEQNMNKAIIAMSTTASIGTFLSYGLSALFALWGAFRFSFLVASVFMFICAFVWFFMHDKVTDRKNSVIPEAEAEKIERKTGANKGVVSTLVIFGVFAVIINFTKDGLSTWVPKILFDTFKLPESLSILLTLLLPLLTVFGTSFLVLLNKRIKEYSGLIAVFFGGASIFVGIVVALIHSSLWVIILIAFGLICLLMGGANNVVTSMLPLSMRGKMNSGFVGGILNGCCYVGSTLSSVGLGAMSDYFGEWSPMFYLLLGLSAFVFIISTCVFIVEHVKNKKQKEQPQE